ncbi:HNH endonuclease [Psychrobacillus sp. INOP01]|uniref:HNH endonuclease n=1 Tax=Psychrobacillus sp. INOP01 TaxID=2829187 RepID=UPI001BA84D9F|nr:HNH endonuclease signature motif containing protein [Psychrobacillus sp. INOP01]QUG41255.1 HNH endonuclease [Psychrobacillus sp. INOP01]
MDHQLEHSNQHKYYDKHQRDKQSNSFYHATAWKKARSIVKIRDNGLCKECMNDKRITVGSIVDHMIPTKEDWDKRLDLDNLQLLCHACHNKKTGKERAKK